MKKSAKIYVAGHRGLIGSALVRALKDRGYKNLLTRPHQALDLTHQNKVDRFFEREKPEYVFLAAARVGGIRANDTYPAEFIYQNQMIQANVLHSASNHGARKLLFFSSSCIYPKKSRQPMKEEYLMTGPMEPTNEAYGAAKMAGLVMCQSYRRQYGANFISVIPANVYGIHDHFDENGHVLAALIAKFHEARVKKKKQVTVWGTGKPRREFFYVDDLADAALFLMENYDRAEPINVGTGQETSIRVLAEKVKEAVGFEGEIVYDTNRPDGNPRRLLDSSRIRAMGWRPGTSLERGLELTCRWYAETILKKSVKP
ncbi:MAG: GDP-fucose synthetase [Nitrospinae bacterium CG11_big_fil_rev_8_21_14_0_20_56_8]|nr:MAG: GDP-fucose synthetase [Nitrospinae bacterium CG11_big_fil_rev_8_21_14_0_20_56_8]